MRIDDANILKPILSNHFKSTRKRLNLSQSDMSERLHISARSYADIERGICLCSAPVLLRFILYCELTPLELLELLENVSDGFEQGGVASSESPPTEPNV